MPEERVYYKVRIKKGPKGWGGPLIVAPRSGRDLIHSVTGGGIHPLAARIAELTGEAPFDGYRSKAGFEQMAVAVIDSGGTARVRRILDLARWPSSRRRRFPGGSVLSR